MQKGHKIILLLVCIYILFISIERCGDNRYINKLEKEYNEYKSIVLADKEISMKRIAEYEDKIAELNGNIDSLNFQAEAKLSQIEDKDREIARLRVLRPQLTDKDAIIENLEGQLRIRDAQYLLALQTIEDKDGIIFSLVQKYETQVKITQEYKLQLEDMTKFQQKTEDALKEMSLKLYQRKQSDRLKNYVIAGLAGLTVYSLLRN